MKLRKLSRCLKLEYVNPYIFVTDGVTFDISNIEYLIYYNL